MATKKSTAPATQVESAEEAARAAKRKAAAEKAARTRAANAAARKAAKAAKAAREAAERGEVAPAETAPIAPEAIPAAAQVAASATEAGSAAPAAAKQPAKKPARNVKAAEAPKPTVAVEQPAVDSDVAYAAPATETSAAPEPESSASALAGTSPSWIKRADMWLNETFPGNKNAVIGGFVGLLVALLFFAIGFGKTLFIVALIVIGVAVGQCADGNPKIVTAISKLTKKR